jgi:hypothetical protein
LLYSILACHVVALNSGRKDIKYNSSVKGQLNPTG